MGGRITRVLKPVKCCFTRETETQFSFWTHLVTRCKIIAETGDKQDISGGSPERAGDCGEEPGTGGDEEEEPNGSRYSAEPDQGAADEVGRAEDGAQVQRDQLRECHQLTHRQAGRGPAIFSPAY